MNGVSAEQNPAPDKATLDRSIASATGALLDLQQPDGHWVFELEADATIPAEYVLLRHYFGEPVDTELEAKIGVYLRRIQSRQHGGWPLFHDGDFDMSATVKAYFALKMIGDDPDAPHMRRAREAIQAHPGGAARCNVFTRALLALYGFLPWRSVPVMPVEIMLLPRWFPFHLDKISYWGRTVIVPLLVLMTLKPKAKNPHGVRIDELFEQPPETHRPAETAPHQKRGWFSFFAAVDRVLRVAEPYMPKAQRQRAIDARGRLGRRAAQRRGRARRDLSGDGQQRDDVRRARLSGGSSAAGDRAALAREAAGGACGRGLLPALRLADLGHRARLPCAARNRRRTRAGADAQGARLAGAQADARREGRLGRAAAGRAARRLGVPVRQPALSRRRRHRGGGDGDGPRARAQVPAAISLTAIARAKEWIYGLQSKNGAWGAFDADNEFYYLNNIPFADHGALLDPPTEDVTARCVSMLAQLGDTPRDVACGGARDRLSPAHAAAGRQLVRPLGHELHLRHLVGAVRAQCRRRRSRGAGDAQGGGLARRHPECRWRLGRGRHELQARLQGLRARAEHRVADRLGAARPDGGGGGGQSGGRARHRLSRAQSRAPTASGTSRTTPRPVFRGCSICATTAIRSSSRSGRWRATATCRAATRARSGSGCEGKAARCSAGGSGSRLPKLNSVGDQTAPVVDRAHLRPDLDRAARTARSGGAPLARRPEARSQPASFARLERECVQDQAKRKERAERQSEQPSSALIFHDTALPPVSSGRKPAGSMARCYLTRTQLRRG